LAKADLGAGAWAGVGAPALGVRPQMRHCALGSGTGRPLPPKTRDPEARRKEDTPERRRAVSRLAESDLGSGGLGWPGGPSASGPPATEASGILISESPRPGSEPRVPQPADEIEAAERKGLFFPETATAAAPTSSRGTMRTPMQKTVAQAGHERTSRHADAKVAPHAVKAFGRGKPLQGACFWKTVQKW
jgi:hypothetical protein